MTRHCGWPHAQSARQKTGIGGKIAAQEQRRKLRTPCCCRYCSLPNSCVSIDVAARFGTQRADALGMPMCRSPFTQRRGLAKVHSFSMPGARADQASPFPPGIWLPLQSRCFASYSSALLFRFSQFLSTFFVHTAQIYFPRYIAPGMRPPRMRFWPRCRCLPRARLRA